MASYYNEHDKFAAAWLRELIKARLIANGEVDERSIELVEPADVRGFTQCHFFAGIGGWSYALRLAGWPDDRHVWTGSCPCQPFSSAGAQAGGHDPRDLWPAWFKLIAECLPSVVFGEQVEAAIGHGWLDRLCDDMEAKGYAIGAVGLPGPVCGAFDIRQRLWFVAESDRSHELRASSSGHEGTSARNERWGSKVQAHGDGASRDMADTDTRGQRITGISAGYGDAVAESYPAKRVPVGDERCGCWDRNAFHRTVGMLPGEICINKSPLDYAKQQRTRRSASSEGRAECAASRDGEDEGRRVVQALDASAVGELAHSSSQGLQKLGRERNESSRSTAAGFWSHAEWIACADGKARPVEPGTFPLAYGVPARVGRLRGYGNAIKPQVAAVFIQAYEDSRVSSERE